MSKRLLTILVATGLVSTGTAAYAQDIDLSAANSAVTWRGTSTNSRAGTFLDQGAVSGTDNSRDLIIGAPGTGAVTGRVYVVFSGNTRTGAQNLSLADAVITGASPGDGFGTMAAVGNILNLENASPRNLLVAAPLADAGRGIVYLFAAGFTAGQSLTTANAAYTIVGAPGDLLGTTLATGDLNGDGRREIIIGAPGTDRIYIINGAAGLSGTLQLESQPASMTLPAPGFGDGLASGDVTGDGIYDLIAGAPSQNSVFVYRGRAGLGLATVPDVWFTGIPGETMGTQIRLGDLDNDSIRDIQIGSPLSDGPGGTRPDCGAIYVMWGSTTLAARAFTSSPADVTFYGEAAGNQLGSFFNYGDINRDTPDDLAMAASGPGGASQLQVFYGRSTKNQFGVLTNGRRVIDLQVAGNINRRVSGIPANGVVSATQIFEVTGEGARDVVVGVATEANGGTAGAGAVYFTLSPRMFLGSKTMIFRVRQSGTGQAGLEVRNTSSIPITWAATSKASWLSVSPASGATVTGASGYFTITASAPMAPGTYVGEIDVNSTSIHLEMRQTLTVTLVIRPISARPLDLDSDARAEIVVYRPSHGYWFVSRSSSGYTTSNTYLWGTTGDIPVPGDYDGDRVVDIAVYRPSQGYWLILKSTSNYSAWESYLWGSTGDIPVPGDYDADARNDLAVFRPSTGSWFILKSSSNFTTADVRSWGAAGDKPVAGDYDADGKVDLAVYRPSTGQWLISLSTTNYASWLSMQWGSTGDVPAPADYDGDLKTDMAVFRPSSGAWFILYSSTGFTTSASYGWGANGDVPVAADYDGDERADIAVFRPSTGAWYILTSTSGYSTWLAQQWGQQGDIPLSNRGSTQ